MDLQYFLNILLRRKWLILAAAIAAAATAFYVVNQQDEKFRATAILSTGIVDITPDLTQENPWVQQFYVDMGFGNLVEFIHSKRNVIFLSYRLLIHDLAPAGESGEEAFRTPEVDKEEDRLEYTEAELQELRVLMLEKIEKLDYALDDSRMERIFKDVSKAYGYDYETIIEDHLKVERKGDTDLLHVSFLSEHPDLSEFAANIFCDDFLKNYQYVQQEGEVKSVNFLSDQVKEKKSQMDSLRSRIQGYQNNNELASLEGQREAVITQVKELQNKRTAFIKQKNSLSKSIREIDRYLVDNRKKSTNDKAVLLVNNRNIQNMEKQLDELNKKWIDGDMKDEKLRKRIELIRKNIAGQVKESASNMDDIDDERLKKKIDDLEQQKIDLEIDYNEAEAGMASADEALRDLRVKSNSFVSDEAYMNRLNQELAIAENQHELIFHEFSKEKLKLDNTVLPVKLFEHAQIPEKSEPKMKGIITGFSGVVGGTMASVLVFLLAFMDYSINTPQKFKSFTKLGLLSTVNKINSKKLDLQHLFSSNGNDPKLEAFRESIRNIRYIIEESGAKNILVTSTKAEEGKTFLIIALAQALTMKNKKVLLVDTNFKNNTLTKMSQKAMEENLLNSRLIGESQMQEDFETRKINNSVNLDNVDIIGNKGSYQSPSEVFAGKDFKTFLERISKNYDHIFFESAAINQYSDAKELTQYADKIVTIFSADNEIKNVDLNSIDFLKSLGDKFLGAILNKVDIKNLG